MFDFRLAYSLEPLPSRPPAETAIDALLDAFCARWLDAEYGPAHIVIADYSLWDESLQFVLDYIAEGHTHDRSPEEIAATVGLMRALQAIPTAARESFMRAHGVS
jgi:hypothetical protein